MEAEKNNNIETLEAMSQEQKRKKKIEIGEDGNYIKPTAEQIEKFERGLETMSEVFENADFPWYVDGGANITLYSGEQKREHKDLDISILKGDLDKLKELLKNKGFEIAETNHLFIKKINNYDSNNIFNEVDLHVHDIDKDGNLIINYTGAKFPKEYIEPIKHKILNGKEINLSHPALVVYHKLYSYEWDRDRVYDIKDLEQIVDKLEIKDFEILRDILTEEFENRKQKILAKFDDFWNIISTKLQNRDEFLIKGVLFEDDDVRRNMQNKNKMSTITIQYIDMIARYISDRNYDISRGDFINKSIEIIDSLENAKEKLEILDHLEKLKNNQ
ncbi:MAG TPA: hypothetical protein PKL13_01285 [bacterium]|nr:hypothetical protein [bacterium]